MLHGIRLYLCPAFDYVFRIVLGMLDIIDMEGRLHGDEEHVSGWDLVYDNGFIEIDPELCGYTTFLGSAVPTVSPDHDDIITIATPEVKKDGKI